MVITEQDHFNLLKDNNKKDLLNEVKTALLQNTVLFLGYSLSHITPWFSFIFDPTAENKFARPVYAIWSNVPETDIAMWRKRGIIVLRDDDFKL